MASKHIEASIKTLSIIGTVVTAFGLAGCGSSDESLDTESLDGAAYESEGIGTLQQGLERALDIELVSINQGLANSSRGALVLDLTEDGTVYRLSADEREIQLLTSGGTIALSDLSQMLGLAPGNLLVGTFQDMSSAAFAPADDGTFELAGGGAEPAKCTPGPTARACWCTGSKDCKDLNKANICRGKTTICGKGSDGKWGCTCIRKA